MVVSDIFRVHRILCSQCPHIHLSRTVTTQRTSLFKIVGLPCPSCIHFTSCLRPRDGGSPTGRHTYGEDDIQVQLMRYSTFKVLDLPCSGPMETRCVVKLYKPSPTPILHVGPVSDLLGRVPLMPLFLC